MWLLAAIQRRTLVDERCSRKQLGLICAYISCYAVVWSMSQKTARRRRYPVAKVKGGWTEAEDQALRT